MSIRVLEPGQSTPQTTRLGDFLLIHNTTPLARLITLGQRLRHSAEAARWTHAACLDGATLVEADASGIRRASASKYDGRLRALIQPGSTGGAALARGYLDRTVGTSYGFLDFASVALAQLTGYGLIVTTSDSMICSQLVAEVLARVGLFVPGPPELVTPAALWDWAR